MENQTILTKEQELPKKSIISRKRKPRTDGFNLKDIIFGYTKNKDQFKAKELIKIYNILKPKGTFDIKGQRNKFINKYHPLGVFLINMQMNNGKWMEFIVNVKEDGGFVFNDGFYIIDEKLKYYNQSAKLYCLDYHEDLCFPINRQIIVDEIRDSVLKHDDFELKNTINPRTLQNVVISDMIKKIFAGAQISSILNFLKMGIILIGIMVLICTIILISMVW